MNRREELRQTAITELLQVLNLPRSDQNPLSQFPATRVVDALLALMEGLFVAKRTGLDDAPLLDPPRRKRQKQYNDAECALAEGIKPIWMLKHTRGPTPHHRLRVECSNCHEEHIPLDQWDMHLRDQHGIITQATIPPEKTS